MSEKARGGAVLLLTAIVASAIAWAFWRFAGASAFDALSMVVMVGLVLENIRLRRKLRQAP